MLHTCRTSVYKFVSAEQTSSLQVVLGPSSDLDHADGNVDCRSSAASGEAGGDDSNAICLNAPRASLGVAPAAFHSLVASQGTGVVHIHTADMAIC
jgi:hypothetical protein